MDIRVPPKRRQLSAGLHDIESQEEMNAMYCTNLVSILD
jgi:hypothetical protein